LRTNLRVEMYYTYAYLREDRTPYYVGKGKGDRVHDKGKKEIKPPKNKSRIIFLKQNLTEEEAFKHEIYMIAVFGRIDLGTGILRNRTNGGEGTSGCIPSEETKRKMSESKKGKTLSDKHRKNLSDAQKGRTFSEEHRRKLSESKKGKSLPEETKNKISEATKGKTFSEETRRKLCEMKLKYYYTIYSTTQDVTYKTNNIKVFCKEHSLNPGNLSITFVGKRNHHKGFRIIKKELYETLDELAQEHSKDPENAL